MKGRKSVSLPPFRPASEFFEFSRFSRPEPNKWADRVNVNLVYYQANYAAILLVFLLVVCIVRPFFFVVLSAVMALGVYLFALRNRTFVVGGRPVSRQELVVGFASVSGLLFLVFGGVHMLSAVGLGLLVTLLHSSLRKRSNKARVTTFIDMWRGETPVSKAMKDIDVEAGQDLDPEDPRSQQILRESANRRSRFRADMIAKYGHARKKD